MRASLEDHPIARFGPSDRAPNPEWAMVPSNVRVHVPCVAAREEELSNPKVEVNAAGGMSQDDQAMSQAIEASLSYNISEDVFHELPLEERVRQGDTYVFLVVRPVLGY